MDFRRILVPHDFSTHATNALRTALALLPRTGGRIVVLHAVVPMTPVTEVPLGGMAPYVDPREIARDARGRLEALVKKVAGPKVARITCKVEIGNPADTIVAAARGMDAIVMSTAGRTGLAHLLIGSVAERVVRHATVPVLTLRPAAARRRKAA